LAGRENGFGGRENDFGGQENHFGGRENDFGGQENHFGGQENDFPGLPPSSAPPQNPIEIRAFGRKRRMSEKIWLPADLPDPHPDRVAAGESCLSRAGYAVRTSTVQPRFFVTGRGQRGMWERSRGEPRAPSGARVGSTGWFCFRLSAHFRSSSSSVVLTECMPSNGLL